MSLVPKPEESSEERAARFERGIRAIYTSSLEGQDFGDFVQSACEDLLGGQEVSCPECGAALHEGPCVQEDDV